MKVGMLTSGGDCQGLNAAIRGVAKALYNQVPGVEIIGVLDGYRGLIEGRFRHMQIEDFSGILTLGGTILGTTRISHSKIRKSAELGASEDNLVARMKASYASLGLDALVILGGNGTHKSAALLSKHGLNIVTLPKTIDNDIFGTDLTFGFDSALEAAVCFIDRIHSTAASHKRVFIVELMGHKAGFLTLAAGIAGGADVILIPELPYHIDAVAGAIKKRHEQGKGFSIIALAEGALSAEDAALSKDERAKKYADVCGGPAHHLASALQKLVDCDIRATIPGHFQRGGSPSAQDRVFASRLGVAAAKAIIEGRFGCMMGLLGSEIAPVSLELIAGRPKLVDVSGGDVMAARALGISFGECSG